MSRKEFLEALAEEFVMEGYTEYDYEAIEEYARIGEIKVNAQDLQDAVAKFRKEHR